METLAQEAFASTIAVSFKVLFFVFVVVAPIALAFAFWWTWIRFVRAKFFAAQSYTLLEMHLPKGVVKPPLSMEFVITSLFQPGGEGTFIDRWIDGSTRAWFSLEIVSIDGQVRFFIWTRSKFKDMIETQLYSQYPDIEIDDVTKNDYTTKIPYDTANYKFWGCEFRKASPAHLPIKTYTAFGMTGAGAEKEEGKIDPITPMIEFFGSLQKGEQVWLQICIRSHGKKRKPGTWFEKVDWKHAANEDLIKRTKRDIKIDPNKPVAPGAINMTEHEKESVKAIEHNLSKLPFDCGMRAVYIATNNAYRKGTEGAIQGIFGAFSVPTLNLLKATEKPGFDYPWQDIFKTKEAKQRRELFYFYKYRAFFIKEYIPFGIKEDNSFVMTTEELASIYHFPGQVARTPNLARITGKKAEPPTNLPI